MCAIFRPKMVHLHRTKKILVKVINITFIYILSPFIVQNSKKNLIADPKLTGCATFGPRMAHFCSNKTFFRRPV